MEALKSFTIAVILFGLLLYILFVPAPTRAAEILLAMPNDTNGHIYLTREPCDLSVQSPDAVNLHRAFSVAYEGTDKAQTFEGCWGRQEIDTEAIPQEYRARAVPAINIYAKNGLRFDYLMTDFSPVESAMP